jgi:hypothetical protein
MAACPRSQHGGISLQQIGQIGQIGAAAIPISAEPATTQNECLFVSTFPGGFLRGV